MIIRHCWNPGYLLAISGIFLAVSTGEIVVQEMEGIPDYMHSGYVNSGREVLYNFQFSNISFYDDLKLCVQTGISKSSQGLSWPLLFTVRHHLGVMSWQLPLVPKTNSSQRIYELEKYLCLDPDVNPPYKDIQVVIFTQCPWNMRYQLQVMATPNYIVRENTTMTLNLSSLASNFFFFKFEDINAQNAVIRISSNDTICMLVSLQPPGCPVYASESDVEYHGTWTTVIREAGITVLKDDFPTGFYLVFIALQTNDKCRQYHGILPENEELVRFNRDLILRNKSLEFEIQTTNPDGSVFQKAILIPLLFYFIILLVLTPVFVYFHRMKHQIVLDGSKVAEEPPPEIARIQLSANVPETEKKDSLTSKLISPVRIADLIKSDTKRLENKSRRFYWSLIIVSVFYFLPVCQFAVLYLKVVWRTGDMDLCFYNFKCANRLDIFFDFNHLYSNVGYVIFGLLFILLVRIKASHLKNMDKTADRRRQCDEYEDDVELEEVEADPARASYKSIISTATTTSLWYRVFPEIVKSRKFGVFYHFGLFYAMGIALALQGLLSGAYHICPTQTTFQFDSSFMYVLVTLTVVKLYQFRHPIYVNANITFVTLAFIAIWAYMGLALDNGGAFKSLFTVFHLTCIFNLLLYQYYVGFLRINGEVVTTLFQVYRYAWAKVKHLLIYRELKTFRRQTVLLNSLTTLQASDYTPNRAFLPTLAICANLAVTILNFTLFTDLDFASQVLQILVINSVVNFCYYISMKFMHKEFKQGMWLQTLTYTVMAIFMWFPSFYYFTRILTSWSGSPAESRARNRDCFFLDYYDFHDVWHFLSAPAMFCTFMILLTIDDDLIGTSKEEIAVF